MQREGELTPSSLLPLAIARALTAEERNDGTLLDSIGQFCFALPERGDKHVRLWAINRHDDHAELCNDGGVCFLDGSSWTPLELRVVAAGFEIWTECTQCLVCSPGPCVPWAHGMGPDWT